VIEHPEAQQHGGKIYLSCDDMETASASVGDTVNFFVYADGNGLGAQHCKAVGGKGGGTGVVKSAAPKVQNAQRAAKTAGKNSTVQQKYVAVKGQVKGQTFAKKTFKLQPTAKSMPSPNGMPGDGAKVSQVPDKTSRQRLTQRISGTIHKWRGEIGWIKPDSKIEGVKKSQLYVHQVDFRQGDESLIGHAVTFFVYQDEAGVGAEHVIVSGAAPPSGKKTAFTPKVLTKSLLPQPKMKGQRKVQGQVAPKMTMVQKTKKNRRKAKGGEKVVRASADLPRTRVTDASVSGEVVEWKGKFGWVKATDAIEHEKAAKRDGKLYVNAKDVIGGDELTVGQAVEFHVYEDGSGLGAEECIAV